MEARSATVTTILILDDNPVVLQMLGVLLRGTGGYRVLEADSEQEAVVQLERYGEEVDLLVADVCIEDRQGRAIANRLTAVSPRLRVLFISGYPKDHLVESGWLEQDDAFLAKPFPPARLMHSVNAILEGQAQAPRSVAARAACAGGAA